MELQLAKRSQAQLHRQGAGQRQSADRQGLHSHVESRANDEFEIKLGKKAIRLIPTGAAAEHSEAADQVDE